MRRASWARPTPRPPTGSADPAARPLSPACPRAAEGAAPGRTAPCAGPGRGRRSSGERGARRGSGARARRPQGPGWGSGGWKRAACGRSRGFGGGRKLAPGRACGSCGRRLEGPRPGRDGRADGPRRRPGRPSAPPGGPGVPTPGPALPERRANPDPPAAGAASGRAGGGREWRESSRATRVARLWSSGTCASDRYAMRRHVYAPARTPALRHTPRQRKATRLPAPRLAASSRRAVGSGRGNGRRIRAHPPRGKGGASGSRPLQHQFSRSGAGAKPQIRERANGRAKPLTRFAKRRSRTANGGGCDAGGGAPFANGRAAASAARPGPRGAGAGGPGARAGPNPSPPPGGRPARPRLAPKAPFG